VDRLGTGGADSQLAVELSPETGSPVVGLLPGSREREVRTLLPLMIESLPLIRAKVPAARFALAQAATIPDELVQELLQGTSVPIRVVRDRTHDLMRLSSLLLVASGTATLEATLLGAPMVILYKLHPLSWMLAKALVKVSWAGLVNILAGRELVPELLQGRANPREIAAAAVPLLCDEDRRRRLQEELGRIARMLGPGGAAARAAREISTLLAERPGRDLK